MAVVIRQADLEADRERLIEGLQQHLNPRTDARRFDWLYAGNPHGPARVWMALDDERDLLVGSSALLPRYFYLEGQRHLGCLFIDSWTHPDYRFLGPALKLQRACVEAARSGEFRVAYDYPRQSMMAVYQRLRIPAADHLVPRTRLLGFDRFLGNRLRSTVLARPIAWLLNPWLRLADLSWPARRSVEVAPATARCGPEFDELAARIGAACRLLVARTADYLNWRFHDHFHLRHEFLLARRAGRLAGYLVLLDQPEAGQLDVVDLQAGPEPGVLEALLARAAATGRSRGRSVLSVSLLESDARLQQAGLRPREGAPRIPLVLVWPHGREAAWSPDGTGGPCFTQGDDSD